MKHEVDRAFFDVAANPPQVGFRRHTFAHPTASIVRAGSISARVAGETRRRRAQDKGWRFRGGSEEEETFGSKRRGRSMCANIVARGNRTQDLRSKTWGVRGVYN
jgi:hypothetical protein